VAGFIAIITKTLPAGLLPQISTDLRVSEAFAGLFGYSVQAGHPIPVK
jgi:predicted MFS family arabinose efflux permease